MTHDRRECRRFRGLTELFESGLNPDNIVLVSGIGQAAKIPHYVTPPCNVFNGLHGRALPAAQF